MKHLVLVFVAVAVFALAFATPAHALQVDIPGLELTPAQSVLIGFLVTSSITVMRLAFDMFHKAKVTIPKWVMQVTVFLIATAVTLIAFPANIPTFDGSSPEAVIQYIGVFYSTVVAPIALTAFLIYDYLLNKLRDIVGKKLGIAGF